MKMLVVNLNFLEKIFLTVFPWQPIFPNMQQNMPKKSDYRVYILKGGSQVQYFAFIILNQAPIQVGRYLEGKLLSRPGMKI